MYLKRFITILFTFFIAKCSISQDTLVISLAQADNQFLSKNYYLLASSMNIEAQKAQIIQAKLYPNPIFTAEVNAYNPERNKAFDVGNAGEKIFQFEQVILLGGKRKNEIELAKTNAAIAELEFQQMVRQLKFRLHSDLFAIGQQQFLLTKYNNQLALLDTLLGAYQVQADKGNIPLKELVRLKGAYLKLNNDRAELLTQYREAQTNLQTLLQTNAIVKFQFTEVEISNYIKPIALEELKLEALKSRPELLITEQNKILAEQYIKYQKSLAVPDVNLYSNYDQRGGAFQNQVNAGLNIPLPFWNRNQGNIKTSQFRLKEADYNLQAMQNEVLSSLQNSFIAYNQIIKEYTKATKLYNQDFEITIKGMTENFQKRNVSIIEFVDFFESYNEVLTEIVRIKSQLVLSGEQLNYVVGKDLY